ncbi:MAG: hypothetical protein JWM27_4931 [Gemmatimonadetes bacterium]|nr:hypothetical protein [Gemmatimonadota bacterium]
MPLPMMRRALWTLGAVALLAGCGASARGPFLQPGPLGPENGDVPRTPGRWLPAARYAAQPHGGLPAAFGPRAGHAPLAGAHLAGFGSYRALVAPLALGTGMPRLSEQALSHGYFGAPGVAGTLGDALARESGGAFRLSSEILPVLVDPDPAFDGRAPRPDELEALIRRALESWSRQADLAAYDNDGPDGIPGSPDDDGTLDAVWVVVEGGQLFAPYTLPGGFEVSSRGRRLRTGPVNVLPAPRGVLPDLRVPLDQMLASLGLARTERFFPAGYPRTVATLGRARLGWLPVEPAGGSDDPAVHDGAAVLVPLSDLPVDAGAWLVERMRDHVLTSRIALRPDGAYQVTDSARWDRGSEQVLPLSYHLGARGPTVLVRWDAAATDPQVNGTPVDEARAARLAGGAPRTDAPVRRAGSEPQVAYRWVRLGTDSVQVAIGGAPLVLP